MRTGRILNASIAVVLAGGAAAWLFVPPVPPAPPELATFDPLVAKAIRRPLWELRLLRFDVDRWLKLGMVYEANNVLDLAVECYEYVVSRRPDDARAWYRLACSLERSGDASAALESLDRAIALDGRFAPLQWRRGWWLLELGKRDQARAAFEAALKIDDSEAAAKAGLAECMLQEGQTEQAIEILERLAQRAKDGHIRRLLANAYLQAGRRDEALVQMHLAGEAKGNWTDRWSNEVATHATGVISVLLTADDVATTDPTSAKRMLETIVEFYPESCALICKLGKINGELGHIDEAQANFERAVEIHPRFAPALAGMSAVWHARRDLSKSLEWIDRAIERNPRAGAIRCQRGNLLVEMFQGREAILEFERAFEMDPGNVDALVFKGRTQSRLNDWRGADETFRRALQGNPTLASAYVGLAAVQMELGDLSEAQRLLHAAANFNEGKDGLSEAQLELSRRQAALRAEQSQ
jgi:tetratricopeptide (TPR) repeat protein